MITKPKATGGERVRVIIEGPDGVLYGQGNIIASANASQVRPQDCAPRLRAALFGRSR